MRVVWRFAVGLVAVLAACGRSDRVATPPRVTAMGPIYRAEAPPGATGVFIAIYFTLADAEESPVNVLIEVSRQGTFAKVGTPGTGDVAVGGEGLSSLTARREGSLHRFLWAAPADLASDEALVVRITPSEPAVPPPMIFPELKGQPAESSPFTLASLGAEPR